MCGLGLSQLENCIIEGENPVYGPETAASEALSKSRVAWECSANWVVNFI